MTKKIWDKRWTTLSARNNGFVFLDYKQRGNQEKDFKIWNKYSVTPTCLNFKYRKFFNKNRKLYKEIRKKLQIA